MPAHHCSICGLYDCAEPDCGHPKNGTCGAPDCGHIYRNATIGCELCKETLMSEYTGLIESLSPLDGRLEPEAKDMRGELQAPLVSIAISLKRIADRLDANTDYRYNGVRPK